MVENKENKWRERVEVAKSVTVSGKGDISGSNWDEIKKYQKEFQKEFCPSCFEFDPKKGDFREKGHEKDPADCKHHWTDIAGQCWNYRKREDVERAKVVFQEEAKRRKENPVISLPSEPKRVQQLKIKLLEYEKRMDPYKAPEMQMGTICKITVLKQLLEKGKINTLVLQEEIVARYGSSFDKQSFLSACAVIENYCLTGGANVHGGTGLPSL